MKMTSLLSLFAISAALSSATVLAIMNAPPAPPTDAGSGGDKDDPVTKLFSSGGKKDLAPSASAKRPDGPTYSRSAYDITPLTKSRIDELAAKLDPEDARILLAKGTERPFCGTLLDNKKDGAYVCKLCGLPLFNSSDKFDSGTGWPSFMRPFDKDHIRYTRDASHGTVRVEITCARCDGHLGHVFEDGPRPTGLRYCLNSGSLDFVEKKDGKLDFPEASRPVATETAYLAGGCFWGVEDRFQQTPGVIDAVSGYMGGTLKNPTYRDVCTDTTGHAETVKVVFDPARISYKELLTKFFKYHDPTQLNRQGPDIGTSYRSAIFASSKAQLDAANAFIQEQQASERFKRRKIVTEVAPVQKAGEFYIAEEYHQDYHVKNGGSCALPEE